MLLCLTFKTIYFILDKATYKNYPHVTNEISHLPFISHFYAHY